MKMFICAKSKRNCDEYLATTAKILNFFAATDHFYYTQNTRIYLQTMISLENDFPWLCKYYKEHRHYCIHGPNKFWAGLWTDLTINNQIMMPYRKSSGVNKRKRDGRSGKKSVGCSTKLL